MGMNQPPPRHWQLPLMLALVLTTLFVAAGLWQMRRAEYKDQLRERTQRAENGPSIVMPPTAVQPEQFDFRRVAASGTWLADGSILLDNRVRNGIVGYEVVTPLQLDHGNLKVLVNRGWIAAPSRREILPAYSTPGEPVRIEGIARIPSERFMELSEHAVVGRVWENLTIERYSRWSGLTLQPVVIYQSGGVEDGLARVAPVPQATGLGADRHRGYAFMWFSLAGLTVVISAILAYRQFNRHDPD